MLADQQGSPTHGDERLGFPQQSMVDDAQPEKSAARRCSVGVFGIEAFRGSVVQDAQRLQDDFL
eukprot:11199283-Lingulodinium_polyedra.AAC.1